MSLIPVNDAGSMAFLLKASLHSTEFAAKAINARTVKISVLAYCFRNMFLTKVRTLSHQ